MTSRVDGVYESLRGRRAQTKSKPARRAGVLGGRTCRAFSSALASPHNRRTVLPASLSVKRPSVATSATAPGDPVNKSANPSIVSSRVSSRPSTAWHVSSPQANLRGETLWRRTLSLRILGT